MVEAPLLVLVPPYPQTGGGGPRNAANKFAVTTVQSSRHNRCRLAPHDGNDEAVVPCSNIVVVEVAMSGCRWIVPLLMVLAWVAARAGTPLPPRVPALTPVPVEITGEAPYEEAVLQATSVLLEQRNFGLAGPLRLETVDMTPDNPNRATAVISADGSRYTVPLRVARVTVTPESRDEVLLISNKPERIPSLRTLCEWRVTSAESARLLYHHVNGTAQPMTLSVEILNPSGQPVRVQIIKAMTGPSYDEMAVGHRAARLFADRASRDAGTVITIPAASVTAPLRTTFPTGATISGLAQFRILTPDTDLVLRVRSHSPSSCYAVAPLREYEPSEVLDDYRYRVTHLNYQGQYVIGGDWLHMPMGREPVPAERPGQDLDGCYGVWHTYTVTVVNPQPEAIAINVIVQARGGAARLTYAVDNGPWRATNVLRPYGDNNLFTITIPAGATRAFTLRTMPESGSNYPLRLVVSSDI